jgi:transcriptional regulator with GAF, ATPase, and Fis domain
MTYYTRLPLIQDPKQLLLDMGQERNLDGLLSMVVRRLAGTPAVALSRIWLRLPAEGCPTCPMRDECPEKVECLHLAASFGNSLGSEDVRYEELDGHFRRFPIGVRKVGKIAQSTTPIEVPDLSLEPGWIVRPEWTTREAILGFGGQPLVHRGEVLGVLAVFSRTRFGPSCIEWLRMIADHTAAAIANARAWEEIEALRKRMQLENEYLQEEVLSSQSFGDLVGQSPPMLALARQIELVAPTDATVLITGESGTGKELVAREIHRRSRRAERPLIRVNCAAIPRELYESEFFGHSRGAFTGAVRDRVGRFELAHGGTIFLDEVGEIPLDLQSKLLRVLQENELERIGEERTRKVDVRVIAATNRDLRNESENGRFRADLYYRLSVFPIETVALRRHKEDIPALAEHFLKLLAPRTGRSVPRLILSHVQQLQRYDWPGNVRELQHTLEKALIISPDGKLSFEGLTSREAAPQSTKTEITMAEPAPLLTETDVRELEKSNYRRALSIANGKVHGPGGAAELLGIKPTTLLSRLKIHGIEARKPDSR